VKVLALDYGAARTGVAISDETGTIVRPLEIVERARTRDGLARIRTIANEHRAGLVIVGLPLTLRGESGPQARETEEFVRALRQVLEVPVDTYDERFTTALAERGPGSAPQDARAAAYLLQSYLTWKSASRI
jgi:putative Holliday junction resolvase